MPMISTYHRVTIELASDIPIGPAPEPETWQPLTTDIRLVEARSGEQSAFTLNDKKGGTYSLTADETMLLLEMLDRLEVSAPWKPMFGFDGATCELALRCANSSMSFGWWGSAPPEWERVGEVFEFAMGLGQAQFDAS